MKSLLSEETRGLLSLPMASGLAFRFRRRATPPSCLHLTGPQEPSFAFGQPPHPAPDNHANRERNYRCVPSYSGKPSQPPSACWLQTLLAHHLQGLPVLRPRLPLGPCHLPGPGVSVLPLQVSVLPLQVSGVSVHLCPAAQGQAFGSAVLVPVQPAY